MPFKTADKILENHNEIVSLNGFFQRNEKRLTKTCVAMIAILDEIYRDADQIG